MSSRFKFIFAVRFLGYLVFFIGLFSFIFMLGPMVQAEVSYRIDKIFGVKRSLPRVITSSQIPGQSSGGPVNFSGVSAAENNIIPKSTEYGIVIEKINANAKIVPNVNPGNEGEYVNALSKGVAEAIGSTRPGEPGNLYLFSHSTGAPWDIVRFNAVFYLLKELNKGDLVVIFYNNKRYDYVIFDKTIAKPSDVSFLINRYDYPVLTLQTCDPPGTILNRLIIRAKLVSN